VPAIQEHGEEVVCLYTRLL